MQVRGHAGLVGIGRLSGREGSPFHPLTQPFGPEARSADKFQTVFLHKDSPLGRHSPVKSFCTTKTTAGIENADPKILFTVEHDRIHENAVEHCFFLRTIYPDDVMLFQIQRIWNIGKGLRLLNCSLELWRERTFCRRILKRKMGRILF